MISSSLHDPQLPGVPKEPRIHRDNLVRFPIRPISMCIVGTSRVQILLTHISNHVLPSLSLSLPLLPLYPAHLPNPKRIPLHWHQWPCCVQSHTILSSFPSAWRALFLSVFFLSLFLSSPSFYTLPSAVVLFTLIFFIYFIIFNYITLK